jgi:hypothetical protein
VNEISTLFFDTHCMSRGLSDFLAWFLKAGAVLLVLNEVRGLVLAAPVLYGMYQTGGSLMGIWIGFCSLGGIALSVVVPLIAAARLKKMSSGLTV